MITSFAGPGTRPRCGRSRARSGGVPTLAALRVHISTVWRWNRDPVTVPPTLPLREAARRLLETETGCLLVVSGGKLVGIATERDLLRALLEAADQDGAPA